MSDKKENKLKKEDVKIVDKKIVIDSPEMMKAIEDESFDVEYSEKNDGIGVAIIVN